MSHMSHGRKRQSIHIWIFEAAQIVFQEKCCYLLRHTFPNTAILVVTKRTLQSPQTIAFLGVQTASLGVQNTSFPV